MNEKVTQRQAILEYIEKHGSITNRDANRIGIMSPTKRISELRFLGYDIKEEWIEVKSKWSDHGKARVKRYSLGEGELNG